MPEAHTGEGDARRACVVHPERKATAEVTNTGTPICSACSRELMTDNGYLWRIMRAEQDARRGAEFWRG